MDAVLFAFSNGYPIFFTIARRPFRFDYLDPGTDLSCLKMRTGEAHCAPNDKSLTTLGGTKSVGHPKELLWERMLFLLGLDGKAPVSGLCHHLRYDDRRLICSNEYSKIFELTFEKCYYFGDQNSSGFVGEKDLDDDTYLCYDYIAFNKGGKHEIDYIHTDDDFVSEIWFYSSDRIDGNTPVRDACAVSKLTGEQLLDFDYSQTMARFKVVHEMESRGMKGTFAHGYTTAGNPKHYNFRTTSIYRETHQQRDGTTPLCEKISIGKINQKGLLQSLPAACVAHDRFLRNW